MLNYQHSLCSAFQVQPWWLFLFATFLISPHHLCRFTWLCGPTRSFPFKQSWNRICPSHCGISTVLWTPCCSVFPLTHFAGRAGEPWVSSDLTATAPMGSCLSWDRGLQKKQIWQPERGLMVNSVKKNVKRNFNIVAKNQIRGVDVMGINMKASFQYELHWLALWILCYILSCYCITASFHFFLLFKVFWVFL